jgi:cytoskeleton protein RodZ
MDSEWQEQPDNQRKASTPGAALAAQREAMGLTIEQVADQLKLAQRQIIAIENGDYAALPNMAVTRGFIRAYAKVLRLDPAPLVAMVEVEPAPVVEAPAPRRDMGASFSESRFPSMTQRQSKPSGLIAFGLVAVVVAAAIGAWQAGLISPQMLSTNGAASDAASAPADSADVASTPLPAPSVPLASAPLAAPADSAASVPAAQDSAAAPAGAATPAAGSPAAAPVTTPAPSAPAPAPAAATPAAATATAAGTLVLTVVEDSWVEIRRPGNLPSLIARLVKGGSTETFEIDGQALLIVGKPENVRATLRGQHLDLPVVPNGTIARVQIK